MHTHIRTTLLGPVIRRFGGGTTDNKHLNWSAPTVLQRVILFICATLLLYGGYRDFHVFFPVLPPRRVEFEVDRYTLPPPLPPTGDLPQIKLQLPLDLEFPHPIHPNVVPSIVHYVYSLSGDRDEFPYFRYLAVRSALVSLCPQLVLFHYGAEAPPHGPYWDLIAPYLVLSPIDQPTEIFGHPVNNYAHRADIVRLQVLLQYGGIYLDIDVFALRSFNRAGLLTRPTVMAMEANWVKDAPEMMPGGLCNGVIVAAPGAPFLKRWFAVYTEFDDSDWAGLSVHKPWELSLAYPQELTILSNRAMFWPLWLEEDVRLVHEPSRPTWLWGGFEFSRTRQLAYHAWESTATKYLEKLTPEFVSRGETSFTRMARAFIGPRDLATMMRLRNETQGSTGSTGTVH